MCYHFIQKWPRCKKGNTCVERSKQQRLVLHKSEKQKLICILGLGSQTDLSQHKWKTKATPTFILTDTNTRIHSNLHILSHTDTHTKDMPDPPAASVLMPLSLLGDTG